MIINNIPTQVIQCLLAEQAWHYKIIPYRKENDTLYLYIANTEPITNIKIELEVLLGQKIHLSPFPLSDIQQALGTYYRKQQYITSNTKQHIQNDNKNFLPNLIEEAQALKSSDIHIEPYEKNARVRMRIDGVMIERYILEKKDYPSLVNKVKIQANLDISEKRLPQDGRIFFSINSTRKIDIRVSVLPTLYGEKIVLRLLSNDTTDIDLEQLGFTKLELQNYLEGVQQPNGMVLISGPTGSGKTTTLYATLKLLNQTTHNILTIEDPIEYTLQGVNQVQLRENIGLDFASALRTFLRQDPDVIMVGEIRDKNTASMAIRASLTGHLVLSTIHTNSAWGIIPRLTDMGIPAYLLADTLNMAVAQRLVRLLCPNCKKKETLNSSIYPQRFKPPVHLNTHYKAVGCEECYYTGYRGRSAVYEVINIDAELSDCIKNEEFKVEHILKERGVKSLADNAFRLFQNGETSMDAIYAILASR